jgi:hypothetical protein
MLTHNPHSGFCLDLSADFAVHSPATAIQLSSWTKVDGKVTLGTGVYTAFLPTSLAKVRGDPIAPGPPMSVRNINCTTIPAVQDLEFTKQVTKADNVLIMDTILRSLNGVNLVLRFLGHSSIVKLLQGSYTLMQRAEGTNTSLNTNFSDLGRRLLFRKYKSPQIYRCLWILENSRLFDEGYWRAGLAGVTAGIS